MGHVVPAHVPSFRPRHGTGAYRSVESPLSFPAAPPGSLLPPPNSSRRRHRHRPPLHLRPHTPSLKACRSISSPLLLENHKLNPERPRTGAGNLMDANSEVSESDGSTGGPRSHRAGSGHGAAQEHFRQARAFRSFPLGTSSHGGGAGRQEPWTGRFDQACRHPHVGVDDCSVRHVLTVLPGER